MSIAITSEHVAAAYAALASGDPQRTSEYFAEDMRWLVPGHNILSGWKNSRADFLHFMARVGELSGNSFQMTPVAVMTGEDTSADVTHNHGTRASDKSRILDIDVIHFLRWKDGKIIEGQGAIFGDGTAQYDAFWSVQEEENNPTTTTNTNMSTPDTTRAIIERYYQLVNAEDWTAWLTLFDEAVAGDEQLAGHFDGIGVLKGAVDAISTGYKPFRMLPLSIIVEGEEACVIWRNQSRNANGVPIAYPSDPDRPVIGANHFKVRNGKIVYMRTVHDSLPFRPFAEKWKIAGLSA